jgi:hypothetical protein
MMWNTPSHKEKIRIIADKYNVKESEVNDIIIYTLRFVRDTIKCGFKKYNGSFLSVKIIPLGTFAVSSLKLKNYFKKYEDYSKWFHDDRELLGRKPKRTKYNRL